MGEKPQVVEMVEPLRYGSHFPPVVPPLPSIKRNRLRRTTIISPRIQTNIHRSSQYCLEKVRGRTFLFVGGSSLLNKEIEKER